MSRFPSELDPLPAAVHRQIDQFCIAYEQKLKAGKRPDLARAVFRQKPALQRPLLRELLAVELEWRVGKGETPTPSQYLEAFPDQSDIVKAVCDRYLNKRDGETVSVLSAEAETHDLLVRCPECHAGIASNKANLKGEITCSACGVIFRLAGEPPAKLDVGSQLGPFELLNVLGTGAFGSVWRARDTRLDRFVAIKIPRRTHLSDEEFEKFLREARAAAQLSHPHIVQVHEVGKLRDVVYIVSDFVDGWSLADWLEGHRLTIREAAELAIPIADALHHAHECGVIHRDLKPANVLIDRKGQPHLTDFGLARRESGEVTVTVEGQILGTPAYMSPEQASGASHLADRRTDVYSFGVLLFHLLTGELPFRGSVRVLLRQVMEEEPPSPRKFNSQLPRDLETITLKCLEKDAAKRYSTAAAVSDDLRRFLRHEPIAARPISRIERTARWARRNPVIAGSLAAVLTILVAASVISIGFALSASRSAGIAKTNEEAANHQKGIAETEAKRADERSAYAERQRQSAETSAAAARESANLASQRLAALVRSTFNLRLTSFNNDLQRNDLQQALTIRDPDRFPEALRDFAWRYNAFTAAADLQSVVAIPKDRRPMHHFDNNIYRAIAMSANGNLLAMVDQARNVVLYDWHTRRELRSLTYHEHAILILAISPNGRFVAAGDEGGFVSVWEVETGQRVLDHRFGGQVRSLAFSPDSNVLAAGLHNSSDIPLINVDDPSARAQTLRSPIPSPLQVIRWASDGRTIAVGGRFKPDNLCTIDVESGKPLTTFRGTPDDELLFDIALSPRDAIVVVACKKNVYVCDLETQGRLQVLPIRGNRVEFSPNGQYLAIAGPEDVVVYNAASWEVAQEFRLDASVYPFLWFDSLGTSIVCGAAGELSQWRIGEPQFPSTHAIDESNGERVVASLAGNRLVTRSAVEPRTIRLRDAKTGIPLRTLSTADDRSSFNSNFELAVSETEQCVFAICSRDTVRCIDVNTGTIRWERRFNLDRGDRWTRVYNCWHLAIDGESIVALTVPGMAVPESRKTTATETVLLNGTTGENFGRIELETYGLYALAHAPLGGLIAGRTEQGNVLIWRDTSFETLASIECPATGSSLQLIFSPDETQLIAIDSRGPMYRINADTWEVEASNRAVSVLASYVAYSPNGDTLLMCGDDQVFMFDPMTLESRGRITSDGGVLRTVFDAVGNLVLTRGDGKHWLSWPISAGPDVRIGTLVGR